MRKTFAAAAALVAALAMLPTPSVAATRAVDVKDFFFDPTVLEADPGDTITWTWRGGVAHNVSAYNGAQWASATMTSGTFSAAFQGGDVFYRCTLHSSLSGQTCDGMCGLVTDDATPPPPPVVAQPANGSTHASPVTLSGTAPDATRVIVMEGNAKRGEAVVGDGEAWSVGITLSSGEHTLHAVARNLLGIESAASAPITVTIDATAPEVTITSPSDLSVTGDPIPVTGSATDDSAVASVTVELLDLILGGTSMTTAACTGCGTVGATWEASVNAPHAGVYRLTARARDAVGNVTASTPVTIIVL